MPGPTELIIIAAIIFLLFGGNMMQRFFKNLGEGIREMRNLKTEINEGEKTLKSEINKIKEA